MTPRSSSTVGAGPHQRPPSIEGQVGVDPPAQLPEPLASAVLAAGQRSAGGEHRVAQGLGDEQVAAPLHLLGQPGEAPGGEPDGGQDEEGRERGGEPDAERAREAPPPGPRRSGPRDEFGQEPERAPAPRRRAAPPARRARRAAAARADPRRRAPPGRPPGSSSGYSLRTTQPSRRQRGRGGCAVGPARRRQRETVERRLDARRVEQPADPPGSDQLRARAPPRPS